VKTLNSHIDSISLQLTATSWTKAALTALCFILISDIFVEEFLLKSLLTGAAFILTAVFLGAFHNQRKRAIQLLHEKADNLEFSLEILQKENPSIVEQLQLARIESQIPPKILVFGNGMTHYLAAFGITAIFYFALPIFSNQAGRVHLISEEQVENPSLTTENASIPILKSVLIQIQAPEYTRLPPITGSDFNVKALKGSIVKWELSFQNEKDLEVFFVDSKEKKLNFQFDNERFTLQEKLLGSGIYSIRAFRNDQQVFQSDFFTLEAIEDLGPIILPEEKEIYKFFFSGNNPKLLLSAQVFDDFKVEQVYIIATLVRGRGENVKFREIRIPVEEKAFQQKSVVTTLSLSGMDFQPGDELYYYWVAQDNKKPETNSSRSDTYFIKYFNETEEGGESIFGLAINVLPDYFRSQRQIIMDTEKLISEKPGKSTKDFNTISNGIGYDQKLLRLRYGQYLGEEFESDAGGGGIENGDLLSGYMHLHDQEGEHDPDFKLEENSHEGHEKNEGQVRGTGIENLLANYLHAHDSEEVNTYFEKSTRGALKAALEQMWQAELYLRLFEPQKSLPYQYKALELLKMVQQKSRVYTKRTGYDPPPLKVEEIRFSGKLDGLAKNLEKQEFEVEDQFESLAFEVLGMLLKEKLSVPDKEKVMQLGRYWSVRIQNSEVGEWSVVVALQKLENGKLDEPGRKLLREKLYSIAKNHKYTGQGNLSNKALKNAFLNKKP
jgi:hypothetical protein